MATLMSSAIGFVGVRSMNDFTTTLSCRSRAAPCLAALRLSSWRTAIRPWTSRRRSWRTCGTGPVPPEGARLMRCRRTRHAGLSRWTIWAARRKRSRTGWWPAAMSGPTRPAATSRTTSRRTGTGRRGFSFAIATAYRAGSRRGNPRNYEGFRLSEPTGATGLEPATPGFGDRCSTKLSYAPGHSDCRRGLPGIRCP